MPHRNRVDPFGDLVADPARGTLYGNRGVLHADDGTIARRHTSERRWIYCRLEFKGRRRELLQPGRYTELFFLDEPTALAAGHRPCAECMHDRYNEFRAAWSPDPISAPELDAALQAERLTPAGERATWHSRLGGLPDGTMVAAGGTAFLLREGALRRWSFSGYGEPVPIEPKRAFEVLTPPSTVSVLRAGFVPFGNVGQMSDIPKSAYCGA
jgi:hypothetical protein